MKDKFCTLYREIVNSKDESKMQILGGIVKDMMMYLIETSPNVASEYIDKLEAVNWKNYVTQKEARNVVAEMNPKPYWSYNQWDNEMLQHSLADEKLGQFNKYALYLTMAMISSDSGETISKLVNNSDIFKPVYNLALDKLTDKDGKFVIRKYFDL